MSEGGKEAVRADAGVVSASEVRRLEERVRELQRLLGSKTMEVEITGRASGAGRSVEQRCRGLKHAETSYTPTANGPYWASR